MSVSLDSSDLRHVSVPFLQLLIVLQFVSKSRGLWSSTLVGLGTPDTNVSLIRSRENVLAIHRELGDKHMLHPFGVVNVSGMSLSVSINSDGLVIRSSDNFLTSWGKINVHDGGNMVLVNINRSRHLSHIP
ncbi:hypothetical protein OGAPHI_004463 [Ogataea philodendri]|uniref:Uncharacterized protein n=1 Tax=Ogataea philodendri TaxID=1378263 RepID=A0A9P8T5G9_9ASCO|nr:uncharacterized protein OGAPHI_004463 [Ogataea philodendri]KAH3666274.1 hypothetical protein OGAPHI_004463 [Ogataea philodendri]